MKPAFGRRLEEVFRQYGRLCVGIDPHPQSLANWNLEDSPTGARHFSLGVLEAASGLAGLIKVQVALFERFGSEGFSVLESVISSARERGFLVIADAKRSDIGSTMRAYASAWLESGSPLACDALTVSTYMGLEALEPAFEVAESQGGGVLVLAVTSNTGAEFIQRARSGQKRVAGIVFDKIKQYSRDCYKANDRKEILPSATYSNLGVVLGATADLGLYDLPLREQTQPNESFLPILAPGFGFQGARVGRIESIFASLLPGVMVSESRSLTDRGFKQTRHLISQKVIEIKNVLIR